MGSISVSVTISSVALMLAARTVEAGEPAADFVRETFGSEVPPSTLSVTGDVARVVGTTLGRAASRNVSYYRSAGDGTVWVLSARGKHGPICAAFFVAQSRIRGCRILEDRERRGRGIRSERYLRQFAGLSLAGGDRFDRRVDGITGATVSSRAIEKMALLALRLDERTHGGAGLAADRAGSALLHGNGKNSSVRRAVAHKMADAVSSIVIVVGACQWGVTGCQRVEFAWRIGFAGVILVWA